jgi:integration host factor subunit alpha
MPTPKTVTRADLAEAIVRKTKLPRNEANRLLTTMLELIEVALIAGDTVKLSRFGNFVVRR